MNVVVLVLSHHSIGLVDKGMHSSLRTTSTHMISAATEVRHRYSASVFGRATVGCLTGLAPNNIHRPEVDLLVSKQAAQSALEKPLIINIVEDLKWTPKSIVPAKYLKTSLQHSSDYPCIGRLY